jgi:hypothetical protein
MKSRQDLPTYLNEKGLVGKGVEVGVLHGVFAKHILTFWGGAKLYCVDAWRHFEGAVDANNPDHNGQLNNMAHSFMNLYEFNDRAVLIRDLSTSAATLFLDHSLDFVYLDAAHDYKNVKLDLESWNNKVKAGGILSGHDYLNSTFKENGHTEFGVKQAVDEFAQKYGYIVNKTNEPDYPSWWIIK